VGIVLGQSVFARHATHVPSGLQNLPGCAAQSVLLRHCTQLDSVVLHSGVSPEQPALVVHPGRHEKSCGSQTGVAVPQSALSRHCTHWPETTRHRGASDGQSVFDAHSTHCCVVVSQILFPAPQSIEVRQPTHTPAPDEVSQMGESCGQFMFVVHAAWHVWSPGQQDGIAAPQSLFFRHAAHCPTPGTQKGADAPQFPLLVQSTQPSVVSHSWPMRHWLLPLMPHSALPGPGMPPPPELELPPPPQATTAPKTTAATVLPMCPRARMLVPPKWGMLDSSSGPSSQASF
jgi:hypothetical protein